MLYVFNICALADVQIWSDGYQQAAYHLKVLRMHITMSMPACSPRDRSSEIAWYRGIDEGPWDGLATFDRVVHPASWALTVQLAAAAAMTERVRLWSCIAILPLRNAALFAKEAATIDVLSGGRLTLGVGIGAHDVEYLATGAPLEKRRQRMDAQVEEMQKIWAEVPPVKEHYPVGPKPVQSGGIPLIAGVEGPKAIARAAKWANGVMDGSHAMHFDPERVSEQRQRVVQGWKQSGRTDVPHFSSCLFFSLGDDPRVQLGEFLVDFLKPYGVDASFIASSTSHGADNLRAAVSGARDAGVDDLLLLPTTADLNELPRAREALGI